MKYPPRRPGGWLRAPVKKAVYRLADGTLCVLRNAPVAVCAVVMVKEIFKLEQCRMVAQIFLAARKSWSKKFLRLPIQNPKSRACQVSRM